MSETMITVDIETIPNVSEELAEELKDSISAPANYKKPESIEKWMDENFTTLYDEKFSKCGLKAETGRILCIGLDINGKEQHIIHSPDEGVMLAKFINIVDSQFMLNKRTPRFIGHNLGFDLGFIYRRMIVHRMYSASIPSPSEYKPWGRAHYCTSTQWAGAKERISLDRLAKTLGLQSSKQGIDGSKVWPFYKEGRIDEILSYCMADVKLTRQIYEIMTGLHTC